MLFSLVKDIWRKRDLRPPETMPTPAPTDYAAQAIARMRAPAQMNVLDIEVTNKCDLACSNCTRLLENQDRFWDITPEQFRLAVRSLKNHWGIIGVIGGNPCMHPKFPELCQILVEEIPDKRRRGLWTNNFFKHRQLAEETFGAFNLNIHGKQQAIPNVENIAGLVWYHFENSNHAPLLTAIKDLYPEQEMWEKIAHCDVNHYWSATIVPNQGQMKYYFCEVAAAFDLARCEDHGLALFDDWWQQPIEVFAEQIRHFCPGCGVAAKIEGTFDYEETDLYTASNADIALKGRKKRGRVIEIKSVDERRHLDRRVTDYSPWKEIINS